DRTFASTKMEVTVFNVQSQIRGLKKINFRTLLDIQPVKEMVIVTFLAVLELMKVGEIKVNQEHNFAEIYLDSCE
uniref:segregation/condensation protein A n=1 Tax=Anaerobutyricum hallii TaxID=39488 RepID=UPI003FED6D61